VTLEAAIVAVAGGAGVMTGVAVEVAGTCTVTGVPAGVADVGVDPGVEVRSGGCVVVGVATSEGATFSPVKTSQCVSGSTIRRADDLVFLPELLLPLSRGCDGADCGVVTAGDTICCWGCC